MSALPYLRSTALSLEALAGLADDGAENRNTAGYAKRIAEAAEALVSTPGALTLLQSKVFSGAESTWTFCLPAIR